MFNNLNLTTVLFLIAALLLVGFVVRNALRPRRIQGRKEIIPVTANDTMIMSRSRRFRNKDTGQE